MSWRFPLPFHARSKLKTAHKSIKTPMPLKTTSLINHTATLSRAHSLSREQWWTVLPCCAHIYVSAAGNSTWLDYSHYLKRWHGHFPFSSLRLFFLYGKQKKNDSRESFQRVELVQNCFFYLRGIVVSIRAAHRRGCSNRTGLAAVFMGFQLSRLLDSEY